MDPETLKNSPAAHMIAEPAVRTLLGQFVGGPVDENVDKLLAASPITYVNEGDAPMLLFQGTKDVLVPYDQALLMATALTEAGVAGRARIPDGNGPRLAGQRDGANSGGDDDVLRRTVAGRRIAARTTWN